MNLIFLFGDWQIHTHKESDSESNMEQRDLIESVGDNSREYV